MVNLFVNLRVHPRPRRLSRVSALALLASWVVLSGCPSTTPTNPTPGPAPGPTFTLSGFVSEAASASGANADPTPIIGALVEITSGIHVGKSSSTDNNGEYSIPGLSGAMNVRVSKDGFVATGATVDMTQDRRQNFFLEVDENAPPPPTVTTLSGTVTSAPGASSPIAGALVEILDGENAGDTATTDGSGAYSIPDVTGTMLVRASRDGFTASEQDLDIEETSTLDFTLMTAPQLTMCVDVINEEVHITNDDTEDLPLTGWVLKTSNDDVSFTFVEDRSCREDLDTFVLRAGETVIITSGEDPDHDPPDRIAGWCTPVWHDPGDTARLYNPLGDLAIEVVGTGGGC